MNRVRGEGGRFYSLPKEHSGHELSSGSIKEEQNPDTDIIHGMLQISSNKVGTRLFWIDNINEDITRHGVTLRGALVLKNDQKMIKFRNI